MNGGFFSRIIYLYQSIHLCFPRKDRFTADFFLGNVAVLRHFAPRFPGWRGRPIRHEVFRVGTKQIRRRNDQLLQLDPELERKMAGSRVGEPAA
jgi:hypothetical protein